MFGRHVKIEPMRYHNSNPLPPSTAGSDLHSWPLIAAPPPFCQTPPLAPHLWVHLALMLMAPDDQVQEGRQVALLKAVLGGGAVLHTVLVQHKHIQPVVRAARVATGRAQPGGGGRRRGGGGEVGKRVEQGRE
jgi:hypothetical protein